MNLIQDRINKGVCPICKGDYGTEFQVVNDSKYGKVWVCKKHRIECDDIALSFSIKEADDTAKKFIKSLPDDLVDADLGNGL